MTEFRQFSGLGEMLKFHPFRLDLRREQLWNGDRPLALRPKTWEVLRLLVERSGQLVHSSEFLDTVWQDVDVTAGTLTQSIAELRRILGDDAGHPRFIETVHHRGYRFIADVRSSPSSEAPRKSVMSVLPPSPAFGEQRAHDDRWLPGRDVELERMDQLLQLALAGQRQIAFVTGEVGIGKTSLIRTFLQHLMIGDTEAPLWISGGKCLEFVGEGETYLPVLDAFERLAQIVGPERFRKALRGRAPSWLAQIPWLSEPDDEHQATSSVHVHRPKRMLREFCAAMEALTAEATLLLWFEDLHWADSATVDLISALASRTEPSRLCVLGTYRPVEAAINRHPIAPLKRDLLQRQACVELPLGLLEKTAVRSYLERQFAPGFEPSLVDLLCERTEGNPLFLATFLNYLVAQDLIGQTDGQSLWTPKCALEKLLNAVPETLAELIELQLDHLDPRTLSMLEAGSVQGVNFTAQAVAAAIDEDVELVERALSALAGRGGFLEVMGAESWPDGSVGETFLFLHAAFRHILYRRQAPTQRQRIHRRVATRLEEGFRDRTAPLAAKLALHFERGGEPRRAVPYLVEAAAGVRQRAGDRDTVAYFERALELVAQLPDSEERARQELDLRMHQWKEINASGVFSSADQDASLQRALELCDQLGDPRCRAYVSSCHTRSLIIQCELDTASALDRRRAETAQRLGDPILLAAAHSEAGDIAYWRGELDRSLKEQALCLRALEGVDPRETRDALGHDPAVLAIGLGCWARWLQGCPDEARRNTAACLERADAGGYVLNLAFALAIALQVEQFRRDVDAAGELAARLMEVSEEYGFELPYPTIFAVLAWTASRTGELDSAIVSLREGVSVCRRTNSRQGLSHHLATIAELELEAGAVREGLASIDEALSFVKTTGECFWEAEIHRLNGALLLLDGERERAEACFRNALEVARSQGARSLELRAATSLSQLWKNQSREDEARSLLASVYGAFTEGFDTRDLREAKALLDSL